MSAEKENGVTTTILVTGGCGYIGSHTVVFLLEQGYNVVVVDNMVNSSSVSLDRVAEICGLTQEERTKRLIFFQVDLCDKDALRKVFEVSPTFQSCIHFAGLKVNKVTRILTRHLHFGVSRLLPSVVLNLLLIHPHSCRTIPTGCR